MAGRRGWAGSCAPQKQDKRDVSAAVNLELEAKAAVLVEEFKRAHVKPPPEDGTFNYIVDIHGRWRGGRFYFCSQYHCPGPNAISPSFDAKFARMTYAGGGRFSLAYMRHTGQWRELYTGLTVDESLATMREDPNFMP